MVFKNYTSFKAPSRIFFEKILKTAAKETKGFGNFSISVNLVSETQIKELNRKYRNKNKITDVLSFPILEKVRLQVSGFKFQDVGDIFICLPFAKKQAKRENISIKENLARLTVHGFLHLVGYDHERSEKDAEKMFKLENDILLKHQWRG